MLFGSYSITHLREMYHDPFQRPLLQRYMYLLIFGAILWFSALFLLIYYWSMLETWARVIGIFGLFFNVGGSLLTIMVVFFGMKDDELLSSMVEEKISSVPLVSSQSQVPTSKSPSPVLTSSSPFDPLKRSQTSTTLPIPSTTASTPIDTVPTTTIPS
jgi:hypothetical protein